MSGKMIVLSTLEVSRVTPLTSLTCISDLCVWYCLICCSSALCTTLGTDRYKNNIRYKNKVAADGHYSYIESRLYVYR